MPVGTRWLLLRTGSHLLAAPLVQVGALSVTEATSVSNDVNAAGAEIPLSLSRRLWGEEDADPGVTIWVRVGTGVGVQVASAEEISEGQEMIPLPALLHRAVGDASPLIGAILWRGRPVPVVDLLSVVDRPEAPRVSRLLDELDR